MNLEILNQVYLFALFILNGFIIGILFDFFRILRKTFNTPDFITYIEDILFWVLAGISLLFSIFVFNNGQLRLYVFIAIISGVILYMLFISKYFVKINVAVINFLKNILGKIISIISYPIVFIITILRRILFRPISFIFINFKLFFKKLFKSIFNSRKKEKNVENLISKEGF